MERVGVRELKQNASKVVGDVERGRPVVITVNGRDAVLMTPLSTEHRWVPAAEAARIWDAMNVEPDPGWIAEIDAARDHDGRIDDPWDGQ